MQEWLSIQMGGMGGKSYVNRGKQIAPQTTCAILYKIALFIWLNQQNDISQTQYLLGLFSV